MNVYQLLEWQKISKLHLIMVLNEIFNQQTLMLRYAESCINFRNLQRFACHTNINFWLSIDILHLIKFEGTVVYIN